MTGNNQLKGTVDLSSILKSELFSNLLPGEKQSVMQRTGNLMLRKDGILFSQGDKAEHVYLLQEGLVRVMKTGLTGEDEEIARFTPGDVIGDFDFARDAEYDARAEAVEDSSLVMFPGFGLTLDSYAREAPHIVSKILLNAAGMVTGRIRTARKLITESMSWVHELHRKIYEDPGTGLWKQNLLTDEVNHLMEEPLALIMLKPDRFKILVDSQGHGAGDKAMVKIAAILRSITRKLGRGWALRFRSNETGVLVSQCEEALAESLTQFISEAMAAIPPVSLGHTAQGEELFSFSGSIAWGIWPLDNNSWDSFFEGVYQLLMDTWKAGGKRIVRYRKESNS